MAPPAILEGLKPQIEEPGGSALSGEGKPGDGSLFILLSSPGFFYALVTVKGEYHGSRK